MTKARKLTKNQAAILYARLAESRPDPRTELDYVNPYTLLVAVVLSAQATDKGVNRATKELFARADTPAKMLRLGEAEAWPPHQDHRPLAQQGQERHRALASADRAPQAARFPTIARRWRRFPASGARPRMSC